jgi:hypothetical protein
LLEDIVPYIMRPIDKTQAICISEGTFSWDFITVRRSSAATEKSDLRYVRMLLTSWRYGPLRTLASSTSDAHSYYIICLLPHFSFQYPLAGQGFCVTLSDVHICYTEMCARDLKMDATLCITNVLDDSAAFIFTVKD